MDPNMRWRSALSVLLAGWAVGIGLTRQSTAQEQSAPHQEPPLNVLEGRVLDHEQKPVAEAIVYAVNAEQGILSYQEPDKVWTRAPNEKVLLFFPKRNGLGSGEDKTDEHGRFEIKSLKQGQYALLAVHPERGIAVVPSVEQPNAGKGIDVVLAPPTFVEGRMEGLPLAGPQFSGALGYHGPEPWRSATEDRKPRVFVHPRIQPSSTGEYRVGPLPVGGEWTLSWYQAIPKRSFGTTLLALPVTVELGKTTTVNVNLEDGESIAGRIVGPKGEPLEDAAVRVSPRSASTADLSASSLILPTYGAVTDAEGRYNVRGLAAGPYDLKAERYAPRVGFG